MSVATGKGVAGPQPRPKWQIILAFNAFLGIPGLATSSGVPAATTFANPEPFAVTIFC